jgi:large subunit ribosomal protein L11
MAKKKEVKSTLRLVIPAGQATPAPPLGAILGQNGVNISQFTQEFNDKTRDKMGDMLPVLVTVYKDTTFEMKIKQPTVAGMLKKAAKITKGSASPKKVKVGKVSSAQVKEIAQKKMPDLNTTNLEAGVRIVEGTAKSLGIDIV